MANGKKKEEPVVNIKFIYMFSNDIDETRKFYTDLLGMKEVSYQNSDEWGWLSYKCSGVDLMFFRAEEKLPVQTEWAGQPGGGVGRKDIQSMSITVPEKDYATTVENLKKEGAKLQSEMPEWRQESYWGITVMDPMGNTIEVYSTPKEKPESTKWPG